jgi:ubiquilin
MAEETSEKLRLTVKTTKEKIEVEVSADATAKQLKEHLSEKKGNLPVAQLCLIFAGRILKDEETLESQGVKSGVTVHVVVRSSGQSQTQQGSSSASSSSPASGGGGGAETGSTGLGMGLGTGGGDFQSQMVQAQQQLMSNPELMSQLMESPLMQSLLANPDTLQSMLTSNPQIQQLMERNPELTHVLHNPELMRQAMEMARNPAAMREMMRSQDRQLSNIESIPGGFNALARMYHEIQEPMMDAAQESIQQQMQNNPFSALLGQQQSKFSHLFYLHLSFSPAPGTPSPGPSVPQGTPNTAPLPNPWASGAASSAPRTTGTSSSRTVSTTTTTTASSASGSGGGVASQSGVGFQQQMMQQAMSNPEMMSQLMQVGMRLCMYISSPTT